MLDNVKINLGAGNDIRQNWINHDIASLDGIDIVHDLNQYPWPWENDSVDHIEMHDVLEHLDNLIGSMEEVWRILKPNGTISINVPYYNSWSAAADPTHKRFFNEFTFKFFDPSTSFCKDRYYYSIARFHTLKEEFMLSLFNPYFIIPGLGNIKISNKIPKTLVGLICNYFMPNLIQDLNVTLEKIPKTSKTIT